MNQLDPRSLIAMAGLMSALMGLVLLLMRRSYPSSIQGLGLWAGAPLLWVLSSLLFSARGVLPDLFTLVAANLVTLAGGICYYQGSRRFLHHAVGWRLWGCVLAASTAAFALLTYVWPDYSLRLALFTALMSWVYLAHLRFLVRHGGGGFAMRLVQAVVLLHVVVLMMRFATVVIGEAGEGLMERSLYQSIYLTSYTLTALLLSVGAVLLATERLRTELEQLAMHDGLTQTLNRRTLLLLCQAELDRSRRKGPGPAILMLDLDHFKEVNDTYGHQHGDAVLVHFAARVRSVLRPGDQLGRYGGEEFFVLLPGADLQAAQTVAARIHAAATSGHALDCPVSIGATARQGPNDTLDVMLARADAALYTAKAQGRNRTCAV